MTENEKELIDLLKKLQAYTGHMLWSFNGSPIDVEIDKIFEKYTGN